MGALAFWQNTCTNHNYNLYHMMCISAHFSGTFGASTNSLCTRQCLAAGTITAEVAQSVPGVSIDVRRGYPPTIPSPRPPPLTRRPCHPVATTLLAITSGVRTGFHKDTQVHIFYRVKNAPGPPRPRRPLLRESCVPRRESWCVREPAARRTSSCATRCGRTSDQRGKPVVPV